MKYLSITFLIALSSCSSQKIEDEKSVPQFDHASVCSKSALKYLAKIDFEGTQTSPKKTAVMADRMKNLAPGVKNCYETELNKISEKPAFNLCFVGGVGMDGKLSFIDFHTNEASLSSTFYNCLEDEANDLDYSDLAGVSVVQPFRLFPQKTN